MVINPEGGYLILLVSRTESKSEREEYIREDKERRRKKTKKNI